MSLPKNKSLLNLDVSYQEHEKLMGANAINLRYITRKCGVKITISKSNAKSTRYKNNLVKVLGHLDKLPKAIKSIRDTSFQVVEVPILEDCLPVKVDALTRIISEKCKFICYLQQDEKRKCLKMKACKKDPDYIKAAVNFLLLNVSSKERKVILPIDVTPSKISFLKKKLSASRILEFYSEVSIEYPEDIGDKSVIDLELKNSTVYINGPFDHCIKVKEEVQKCLPVELNFDIIRKSSFSTDLIVELENRYNIEIIQRDSKRVIVKGAEGELINHIRVMEQLIQCAKVQCATNTKKSLMRPVKFGRSAQFSKRVQELYTDNKEEKHLQSHNEDIQASSIDKTLVLKCSSTLDHSQTNATKPGSLGRSDNCPEQASSEAETLGNSDNCSEDGSRESTSDFHMVENVSTTNKPGLKDLELSNPFPVLNYPLLPEDADDLMYFYLQLAKERIAKLEKNNRVHKLFAEIDCSSDEKDLDDSSKDVERGPFSDSEEPSKFPIDCSSIQEEDFKELNNMDAEIDCLSGDKEDFKHLKDQDTSSKDANECSEVPIGLVISLRHVFDDADDLICSFLNRN